MSGHRIISGQKDAPLRGRQLGILNLTQQFYICRPPLRKIPKKIACKRYGNGMVLTITVGENMSYLGILPVATYKGIPPSSHQWIFEGLRQ